MAGHDAIGARGPTATTDPRSVVAAAVRERTRAGPTLVLTDGPLELPSCASLFGYADRKANVAVVSTARLRAGDEARLDARLCTVVAHELGHLEGLEHCGDSRCAMHAARDVEDLDRRSDETCGRCPRSHARWKRLAGIAVAAVLLVAGVLVVERLSTPMGGDEFMMPFT